MATSQRLIIEHHSNERRDFLITLSVNISMSKAPRYPSRQAPPEEDLESDNRPFYANKETERLAQPLLRLTLLEQKFRAHWSNIKECRSRTRANLELNPRAADSKPVTRAPTRQPNPVASNPLRSRTPCFPACHRVPGRSRIKPSSDGSDPGNHHRVLSTRLRCRGSNAMPMDQTGPGTSMRSARRSRRNSTARYDALRPTTLGT
jgi:hypothetical protein